ncbi:hypothetical protein AA0472_2288 [Acetobacter estunensis NRIC 0472]|nr:hypothetical protein AA0472_2288 [Acetobacter estunensis NRIC 0472]
MLAREERALLSVVSVASLVVEDVLVATFVAVAERAAVTVVDRRLVVEELDVVALTMKSYPSGCDVDAA